MTPYLRISVSPCLRVSVVNLNCFPIETWVAGKARAGFTRFLKTTGRWSGCGGTLTRFRYIVRTFCDVN